MQDDDVPRDPNWLKYALILYGNLPKLAVLGGLRGRMDYGTIMDTRSNYINGPKYGAQSSKRGCCKKIVHWEPKSKIPFMFMYKVWAHAHEQRLAASPQIRVERHTWEAFFFRPGAQC